MYKTVLKKVYFKIYLNYSVMILLYTFYFLIKNIIWFSLIQIKKINVSKVIYILFNEFLEINFLIK